LSQNIFNYLGEIPSPASERAAISMLRGFAALFMLRAFSSFNYLFMAAFQINENQFADFYDLRCQLSSDSLRCSLLLLSVVQLKVLLIANS